MGVGGGGGRGEDNKLFSFFLRNNIFRLGAHIYKELLEDTAFLRTCHQFTQNYYKAQLSIRKIQLHQTHKPFK